MALARTLFLTAIVFLGPLRPVRSGEPVSLSPTAPDAARTVILARGLDAEQTLVLSTALAAAEHPGVLLLDTPGARTANQRFIDEFRPAAVVTVDPPAASEVIFDESFRSALFPKAKSIVVVNTTSRRLLLHATALAGAARAPLLIWRGSEDGRRLRFSIDHGEIREVLNVGNPTLMVSDLDVVKTRQLTDEESVRAATLKFLSAHDPIETLVVANPTDTGLAELAPWVAARHRAALVLTNDKGDDATAAVRRALKNPALERAENLLLLARPGAIRTERRDNPAAGKDSFIEMEPFTPDGQEPYTFATGRLFHADPGIVALMLARERLLPPPGTPRTALVASNPGNSLPLLETFSRVSARELVNRGYQTTALLGDTLSARQLRQRLPDADVFLWEGHHNTLVKDWGFVTWDEPLRPSLMFLQSCLALTEEKASPLFDRGAVAVVGSSSRIYSATGGAFSLAYLDGVLYEGQSLGGALRQAKNFLLAYSLLKDKRLGPNAKLGGANLRSAWAFTLWGDPTLRLPAPPTPEAAAASVHCRVRGDAITLTVPSTAGAEESDKYRVPYRPNERLAGLVRPTGDDDKKLVPFVFAEVKLPDGPAGTTPRLETKLPDSAWTFVWDARRRAGYLLAMPGDGTREVRFRVIWDKEQAARRP